MSNNSRSEIWLTIDSLTFGGIESYVLELAKGLKSHQIPVFVWLVRDYRASPPLCELLEKHNIDYGFLSQRSFASLPTLIYKIQKYRPLAIHAHGYKASLLAKMTRMLTGCRQISTYHAGETAEGVLRIYDALDRYSAFISTASLTVSNQIQTRIPFSTQYLNNFIDTTQVSESSGNQIAFVGRLSKEKAADRFLQLAQKHPTKNFDIYGTGDEERTLKQAASDNVTFHGHQTNMNQVWESVGFLIICSRFEGLPMTALEAMARGIIVISLDIGNLSKLISHQKNGFIYDSFEQLCRDFSTIQTLPHRQLIEIKRSAQQTIQDDFSQQALIPQLLKIYHSNSVQSDYQFDK
ncbi:glycosyltransferase family 4 protein [Vibrio atypicus]|uniref:glycosyltransferase family 4 protein n=1 Tax=Vibrio atypicus TaxID=558271 RepID=UPI0037366745